MVWRIPPRSCPAEAETAPPCQNNFRSTAVRRAEALPRENRSLTPSKSEHQANQTHDEPVTLPLAGTDDRHAVSGVERRSSVEDPHRYPARDQMRASVTLHGAMAARLLLAAPSRPLRSFESNLASGVSRWAAIHRLWRPCRGSCAGSPASHQTRRGLRPRRATLPQSSRRANVRPASRDHL